MWHLSCECTQPLHECMPCSLYTVMHHQSAVCVCVWERKGGGEMEVWGKAWCFPSSSHKVCTHRPSFKKGCIGLIQYNYSFWGKATGLVQACQNMVLSYSLQILSCSLPPSFPPCLVLSFVCWIQIPLSCRGRTGACEGRERCTSPDIDFAVRSLPQAVANQRRKALLGNNSMK